MAKGRKQSETFNYVDSNDVEHKITPVLFGLDDLSETEVQRLALKAYRMEAMADFKRDMEALEPSLVFNAKVRGDMAQLLPDVPPETLTKWEEKYPTAWPIEWTHTLSVDKLKSTD